MHRYQQQLTRFSSKPQSKYFHYIERDKNPFQTFPEKTKLFFHLGVVGRGSFHPFQNMEIATLTSFARNDKFFPVTQSLRLCILQAWSLAVKGEIASSGFRPSRNDKLPEILTGFFEPLRMTKLSMTKKCFCFLRPLFKVLWRFRHPARNSSSSK